MGTDRIVVVRLFILLLVSAVLVFGETFHLYLKDGSDQLVREYQVQGDRVRFFTTERGDWEEIPTSLVDLNRTEQERKNKRGAAGREAQQIAEEDQARRELQREIASVPHDTGAYFNTGTKVEPVSPAKYQIVTNKTRAVMKILSPVPLLSGKASVIIDGEHAALVVHDDRPTFYFRPEREESFGIVRVTPKKGHRIVENLDIQTVTNLADPKRQEIPVFQQQIADNLYKVWPEKPITPGEYAVVEYDDNGESQDIQLLVWDFAYQGASK